MYTSCPHCQTTYRLSSEDLRKADGAVECGHCGEQFNALQTLSESPTVTLPALSPVDVAAPGEEQLADDDAGAEEEQESDDSDGLTDIDDDAGAESAQEDEEKIDHDRAEGPGETHEGENEPERKEPLDETTETEPEDADREDGSDEARDDADATEGDADGADTGENADEETEEEQGDHEHADEEPSDRDGKVEPDHNADDLETNRENSDHVDEPREDVTDESHAEQATENGDTDARRDASAPAPWETSATDNDSATVDEDEEDDEYDLVDEESDTVDLGEYDWQQTTVVQPAEAKVAISVEDAEDQGGVEPSSDTLPSELSASTGGGGIHWVRWLIPAILIALALVWVHQSRDKLARNAYLRPVLVTAYGLVGIQVEPLGDIRSIAILDSNASEDLGSGLTVNVTYRNLADYPQRYPILRVTLEDRWGESVSVRHFNPSEYLSGFVAGRFLGGGESASGEAVMASAGTAAVGFNVDLCTRTPAGEIRCASDP